MPSPGLLDSSLDFTVLAQSGNFTFLIGFHNRHLSLHPDWAYPATPNGVVPVPLHVHTELIIGEDQSVWGWAPVSSHRAADIAKRNFAEWFRNLTEGELLAYAAEFEDEFADDDEFEEDDDEDEGFV